MRVTYEFVVLESKVCETYLWNQSYIIDRSVGLVTKLLCSVTRAVAVVKQHESLPIQKSLDAGR